ITTGVGKPLWLPALAKRAFLDAGLLGLLAAAAALLSRERAGTLWLRVAVALSAAGLGWAAGGRAPVRPLPSVALATVVGFLVAVAAFLAKDIPHRAFLAGLATFAGLAGLRSAFAQNVASHFGGPGQFACALTTLVALLVLAPRLLLDRTRAASYLRTLLATGLFCVCWWHAAVTIRFLRYP